MAKGKKVKKEKKEFKPASSAKPTESKSEIGNAIAAVEHVLENKGNAPIGSLGNLIVKAKTSNNAASDEQKQKIAASLVNDVQALVGELKKVIANNKQLEAENSQALSKNKQTQEYSEEVKKKVELDKKELEGKSKQMTLEQNKNAEETARVAELLRSLNEREIDAESGFGKKNIEMLEKFKADKDLLSAQSIEQKVKLENEIKKLLTQRDSLTEEDNNLIDKKLKELKTKENELEEAQLEVARQREKNEKTLRQSKFNIDDVEAYKRELYEDVKAENVHQLSTLKNRNESLEQQIEKFQQSDSRHLEALGAHADFGREFGDESPQKVAKKLTEYKEQIQILKEKLDGSPSKHIEDQYKAKCREYDVLDQAHRDLQQEQQKVQVKMVKMDTSVIALEEKEKQKQTILKHNELLEGHLRHLQDDVDNLLNLKQGRSPFEALLKLDEDLRARGITETVPSLKTFVTELQHRIAWDEKESKTLYYSLKDIQLFIAGLSMSRLHILQGISGTGKTSLPIAFARAVGGGCEIISVQAGWRDKGDLIGHFNAFEKKFYEQATLQALYKAQCPTYADRPYIIVLDEMNISRPEQYFAEFLSALELDPIKRKLTLMTSSQNNAPELLIDGKGIKIPENVWFVGTANHDETTYEFADKTYDRAHLMTLPRHKHTFEVDKTLGPVTFSFSSLEEAFEEASKKHADTVASIIQEMDDSDFLEVLDNEFNVNWGNRFERHLMRFIPVMLECGSNIGIALDHMLATKVLREGKATGRYDTDGENIDNLIEALENFWENCTSLKGKPEACLKLLNQELKKKSQT